MRRPLLGMLLCLAACVPIVSQPATAGALQIVHHTRLPDSGVVASVVVDVAPPDRDDDGVANSEDRCPGTAGVASQRGCPPPAPAPATAASAEGIAPPAPGGATVATTTAVPGILETIKQCESGGSYTVVNSSGHGGAYQFDQSTWDAYGGTGSPSTAPPAEQDQVAANAYAAAGTAPWQASVNCWGGG